jgi:acetylornithine deacetylase/succinyl-diaminopimelate desuccinylase-like protein
MEAVNRYLEANRAALQERLRLLVGAGDGPPPVGQALLVALARPLAESGLLLQSPVRPGRPLVATGGRPDGRRLLLLFHLDEPGPPGAPGGSRAGLVAALAALAALRAAEQPLAIGVTLVCEQDRARGPAGAERQGAPTADICLWDGGDVVGDRPWVALGSHGLLRVRLRAAGAAGPVGLGAVIANPGWRLIWALAALKSMNEEVHIPRFYDPVRTPEPDEAAALDEIAPALAEGLAGRGLAPLPGLPGGKLALVQAFSPAVCVTGLGVDAAPGQLPSAAWADVTLTLVPDQAPAEVVSALVEHLEARQLGDVAVEVIAAFPGQTTPPYAPLVGLVGEVATAAWGVAPVLRPYADRQAALARVADNDAVATVGIGPGYAPWPELEERVARQARLLGALLTRLPDLDAKRADR